MWLFGGLVGLLVLVIVGEVLLSTYGKSDDAEEARKAADVKIKNEAQDTIKLCLEEIISKNSLFTQVIPQEGKRITEEIAERAKGEGDRSYEYSVIVMDGIMEIEGKLYKFDKYGLEKISGSYSFLILAQRATEIFEASVERELKQRNLSVSLEKNSYTGATNYYSVTYNVKPN